ncbi:TRNA/RRNA METHYLTRANSFERASE [Mycoplasmopsis pulmonis]|uniref:Putative tRNA (cytidine(34)-2'-O)-methyltransferase n=1 Tax=Mycoplasmopsis pulmonis (strain UAB CTIP) TaxID=272635 RepID=Q98QQ8_MYCPU|nr:tRNA (cytidine(34)-2'-O)-methyltransferase [Mycoplasmopsis pulmonis]MDZ7293263.1 tRNA (cytidine(34)-2'-O)-methyltransferase [Mycoplasmopsis pulmonis]CAC13476.1 TRNA/RRNA METHYLTRANSFERASE [Mycoplasmopsis pulmonis]VEU68066.1 tRNA/rRNA methyltransferase [Mycoplasmopsis pulmonis]
MINIVLYQPEIPPNTGNIIRTCFATSSKLHIIKPIAFDLNPRFLKRSAAGHLLSEIQHEVHDSYNDFLAKYQNENIFYITRYSQKSYSDIDFKLETFDGKKDIFFVFGTESTGIPKKILSQNIDKTLRIPMAPENRSLNLANSVVVIIYECLRQLDFPNLSKYEIQKGKNFLNE